MERYVLFGQNGGWDEYIYYSDNKTGLLRDAYKILKRGSTSYLEDRKTRKVWKLTLKQKIVKRWTYTEPREKK